MDLMQAYLLIKPTGTLSDVEIAYGKKVMERAAWRKGGGTWVGQNREWGLRIQANRGCITGNASAVVEAFSLLWQGIVISTDPAGGIQRDRSFHQHG